MLEEFCQQQSTQFDDLDFDNEINDNIANELKEKNLHENMTVPTSTQVDLLHSSLLTPPITPQVGDVAFQFYSRQNPSHQVTEIEQQSTQFYDLDFNNAKNDNIANVLKEKNLHENITVPTSNHVDTL